MPFAGSISWSWKQAHLFQKTFWCTYLPLGLVIKQHWFSSLFLQQEGRSFLTALNKLNILLISSSFSPLLLSPAAVLRARSSSSQPLYIKLQLHWHKLQLQMACLQNPNSSNPAHTDARMILLASIFPVFATQVFKNSAVFLLPLFSCCKFMTTFLPICTFGDIQ